MNLSGQDWGEVVIRKKAPTGASAHSASAINAAIKAGAQVDSVKKQDAGGNRSSTKGLVSTAAKLDNETEVFAHETVSSELKKQIQSARLAKKMTQAQLGQLINEKPQIINEYESGKAIPNAQILGKMSRVLGVTLRKSGAPPPAKKAPAKK